MVTSWSERDTAMAAIDRAVHRLRQRQPHGALRITNLLLVAVAEEGAARPSVPVILRELVARTPSRAVVITTAAGDRSAIDASVSTRTVRRGGGTVLVEDVSLRVSGPAAEHLDSIIMSLAAGNMPVVVWLCGRLPGGDSALLAVADRVIADSRTAGGTAAFARLDALHQAQPVTDLAWVALEPVRRAVAGIMAGPERARFLAGVRRVEVAGPPVSATLLAGWLASSLPSPPEAVEIGAARRLQLRITADDEGREAAFTLTPGPGRAEVTVGVEVAGTPAWRQTLLLAPVSMLPTLHRALTLTSPDELWERALAAALARLAR